MNEIVYQDFPDGEELSFGDAIPDNFPVTERNFTFLVEKVNELFTTVKDLTDQLNELQQKCE